MAKATDKALSFEESMEALGKIVEAIEAGTVGLEDSLARYEQGTELIKRCRNILQQAERRIDLLAQQGESVTATPMDADALRQAAAGNSPSQAASTDACAPITGNDGSAG